MEFSLDCPRCKTRNAGCIQKGDTVSVCDPDNTPVTEYFRLVQCKVCEGVFLFEEGVVDNADSIYQRTYPSTAITECPEYVPTEAAKAFVQGCELANMRGPKRGDVPLDFLDPAAIALRRALDVASLALCNSNGQRDAQLRERLHKLKTNDLITAAMADWAGQIRIAGNDGAHAAQGVTASDVAEMQEFVRMFFLYAFTLPERMKLARASATGDGTASET